MWGEGGGDPGAVAVEEAVQGLESGAPVGGGGEVGVDDGEVGQSLECSPAGTG